jgi:hypothetical protein
VEFFEIGYNDQLQISDRSLHVQTEVLGKRELKIKTAVLERGTVVHVTARSWPAHLGIEEIQSLAETQHQQVVRQLREGQLAS